METIAQPPWRWKEQGNCYGEDPEIFQISKPSKQELGFIYDVYCSTCPVLTECLNWAIAADEKGIWAGTSFEQRRVIRKGLRISDQVPRVPEDVDLNLFHKLQPAQPIYEEQSA